jgi:3-deoxy-7-phosphoheptulonate synthase
LRGGTKHPNYDPETIRDTSEKLQQAGLSAAIVVDCSHANSGKDFERQAIVCRDIAGQVAQGETGIVGVMLESHILAGTQKVVPGQPLTYGQSITDACMSWETTAVLLDELAEAVRTRRSANSAAK